MILSISSRTWNVLVNIDTNLVFWRTLKPVVFSTQFGVELETAVKNSKEKQKRCLTEKNTNPHNAITKAFWTLVCRFGHPKNVTKNFIRVKKE